MSYETLRLIFIGGAVLSGICFVIAVVLFFVLGIPSVIGGLTGATAKKGIEDIRSRNESAGRRAYRTSPANKAKDKTAAKRRPADKSTGASNGAMVTSKIGTNRLLAMAQESAAASNETTLLADEYGGTTVLSSQPETTVLAQQEYTGAPETGEFAIEYEITYVSSDEVIE